MINIDIGTIRKNIDTIKKISNKKIYPVVKKNAYGLGSVKISQNIEDLVDGFCVCSLEEGIELRDNNIKKDVLILSGIFEKDWKVTHEKSLTMVLTSIENIESLIDFVEKYPISIQIKIDTGIGRLGLLPNVVVENIEKIKLLKPFISGIMTHLSMSDAENDNFSNIQVNKFEETLSFLNKNDVHPEKIHCFNSYGILHFNTKLDNYIRPGDLIYGFSNHPDMQSCVELYVPIIQIKTVPKNTPIGYSCSYVTPNETKIVTVLFGYADGYPKELSNKSWAMINKKIYPIVGLISMNYITISVPVEDPVALDDKVTLISSVKNSPIYLLYLSSLANIEPCEFCCRMDKTINKEYSLP